MKTKKFKLTIGISPGYFHDNTGENDIYSLFQKEMAKYFERTGVYISAIIHPGKVIYHEDWGCPHGGENVYIITGVNNPEFIPLDKWEKAVMEFSNILMEKLEQKTTILEFNEVDLIYLKNKK